MEDSMDASEMWPKKFQVNSDQLERATSEREFVGAAFELLKEVGTLATIAASVIPKTPHARNEAILCGHVVRMAKLARVLIVSTAEERGEHHLSIVRQMLDSASAVLYLLDDDGSGARFDSYVGDGLVAEREFLKNVLANQNARGSSLPIEERIYRSMQRTARLGGSDMAELIKENKSRSSFGWPSAEERLRLLGPNAYDAYRMGSNELHGTWTDVLRLHLVEKGGAFEPNFDPIAPRPQPILSAALIVCEVLLSYTEHISQAEAFHEHLTDLRERLRVADDLHEKYLQKVGEETSD